LAETINGLYKAEVIWRQRSWRTHRPLKWPPCVGWTGTTINAFFGPIGYIPPAEAEANYYAALENLDMAA
jgi:hypothetical protein